MLPRSIRLHVEPWWKNVNVANGLSGWFRRHFVLLEVIVELEGRADEALFTGFLLEHSGGLYWVTARHCLDEVLDYVRREDICVRSTRWYDGYEVANAKSIPFAFADAGARRSDAFDVAVVQLPNYVIELMRKNSEFHPLNEVAWARGGSTPEGSYVLGYPLEWQQKNVDSTPEVHTLSFEASLACLPLDPLSADAGREPESFWGDASCMYAAVSLPKGTPMDLSNIKGMSGGAILGVARDSGTIRYWLYGVQSEWLPRSHVVKAVPIEAAVDLIEQTGAWPRLGDGE